MDTELIEKRALNEDLIRAVLNLTRKEQIARLSWLSDNTIERVAGELFRRTLLEVERQHEVG